VSVVPSGAHVRPAQNTLEQLDLEPSGIRVLRRILKGALAAKASDVHLRAGQPPHVRIEGELCPLKHSPLDAAELGIAIRRLCTWAEVPSDKMDRRQIEFSVEVPEIGRFRTHVYRQRGTHAAVLRHIPSPIPSFADLRLPAVFKPISLEQRGLVVISGATGNGKSTTIASMLQYMNQQRCRHVVTIEEPIEFVLDDDMCSFSQREVGVDVDDHRAGLIGALREDPDVIFIGEVRSAEEFDVALHAAETGHLVVTTLHSVDVMSALTRMIGYYPVDRQSSARERLAYATTAIVAQKLLPSRGGAERVIATEVLRRGATIADCIRDPARFRNLPNALDAGFHDLGTYTIDHQLIGMVKNGQIDVDTARAAARSPKDLVRSLKLNR